MQTTAGIKGVDLDAAAMHGTAAGGKSSSGFSAPELARLLLRERRGEAERGEVVEVDEGQEAPGSPGGGGGAVAGQGLLASTAFDAYSFGVMAFQLCAHEGASMWFCDQADNIVKAADLNNVARPVQPQSPRLGPGLAQRALARGSLFHCGKERSLTKKSSP